MIRLFRPEDRDSVRQICCDTADNGHPVGQFFPDRDLFADFWTNFYTEYEASSLWVAEQEGQVVGYLTGCINERRYRWIMASKIIPQLAFKLLLKRSKIIMPVLGLFFENVIQSLRSKDIIWKASAPGKTGHLHINLLKSGRGQGWGRQLLDHFFALAHKASIRTIRIGVREDNSDARSFFEKNGFVLKRKRFGYRVLTPERHDYWVVEYEKEDV